MSENGEIYTAGKNFTLMPAVTAVTNSTSDTENHKNKVDLTKHIYIIERTYYCPPYP